MGESCFKIQPLLWELPGCSGLVSCLNEFCSIRGRDDPVFPRLSPPSSPCSVFHRLDWGLAARLGDLPHGRAEGAAGSEASHPRAVLQRAAPLSGCPTSSRRTSCPIKPALKLGAHRVGSAGENRVPFQLLLFLQGLQC